MQILKKTLITAIALGALGAASPALAQVKLGFLGGFTGPIESLTPPIFAGAKLAVHEINAQGGILGGQPLELIAGDSTCADATAAANAADKQINTDNVSAIVGPMCSGATISAANNAGIPGNTVLISPSATAPSVSDVKDNDLLFRTAPSDAYQGDVLARLLLAKGIKEIAVTYVNNDYGKGLADSLTAAFEKNGGTVAISEGHEEGKADKARPTIAPSWARWPLPAPRRWSFWPMPTVRDKPFCARRSKRVILPSLLAATAW